jgi:hypothetical protein
MLKFGDVLILIILASVLVIALTAIKRGYTGVRRSKEFEAPSKKMKIGYWLISSVHMWAGILIAVCYLIAFVIFLLNYK